MTTYNYNTPVNSIPIVKQLNAVFRAIPDEDLITALKAPTGRPGLKAFPIWTTKLAYIVGNQ